MHSSIKPFEDQRSHQPFENQLFPSTLWKPTFSLWLTHISPILGWNGLQKDICHFATKNFNFLAVLSVLHAMRFESRIRKVEYIRPCKRGIWGHLRGNIAFNRNDTSSRKVNRKDARKKKQEKCYPGNCPEKKWHPVRVRI